MTIKNFEQYLLFNVVKNNVHIHYVGLLYFNRNFLITTFLLSIV